jgi:hypothetical protein
MSVLHQIAEARASAITLRASAKACAPEQGALRFRLMRAAEALDAMALLALSLVEHVGKLEQQLKAAVQGRAP